MKRIICVEDEEDIRHLLMDELTDAGYEVVEAANGQLGLDAILRDKPDLVLCDISMPVMDGHLLLQYLRENHPEFADTPFIFLSALADREHIVEGKKLGADDYLTKPIDLDLLLVTVKSRLDQVERMNARKEEQFIKIYQSINGTNKYKKAQQTKCKESNLQTMKPAARQSDQLNVSLEAGFLKLAQKTNGTALVGHMQVVGLEDIKDVLGDRWHKQFKQIRALAENTIRKHLAEADIFELWEDIKFLIYFTGLDKKAAAAKARAISNEIRQKVLGGDGLANEVVESCSIDADLQQIEIPPESLKSADDIVDVVKAKLKQSSENARKNERVTLDKIVNNCEIVL
ncbi:MAG: response regulator, partial [Pseudomonadota bacterium]